MRTMIGLLVLLMEVVLSARQPGEIDSTFRSGGGVEGPVEVMAMQRDGKVLISGNFSVVQNSRCWGLARLSTSGKVDPSFNAGNGPGAAVYSIAVQSNGKILIGGEFLLYNGTTCARIVRLNANGSLDLSFNAGAGASAAVRAIVVQPDGKILIAGDFTSYNGTARNHIARLNVDGSLDLEFDPGSGADGAIFCLALQTDGDVLMGGDFGTYNGSSRSRLARLNSNGSLDAGFNSGGGPSDRVRTLAVQTGGKVVIGGLFTSFNGTGRNRVARVNPDGLLDTAFDPGSGADGEVLDLAVNSSGKVVVGGRFLFFNGLSRSRIARLNSNGSLDSAFNPGSGMDDDVLAVEMQADGKVVAGGEFIRCHLAGRNHLARMNASGSIDASYNAGMGADLAVAAIALQPDKKVIIGGNFLSYNGVPRNGVARLKADGTLDLSFDPGIGVNSSPSAIIVQPDGKILLAGGFASYDGVARRGIVRINADGSLDDLFDPGTGVASSISSPIVNAMALQPDGKIIIGGEFNSFDGTARNRLARLNIDGTLDTSFLATGAGANDVIRGLVLQTDGKVVIGGEFTLYNSAARAYVARVESNGAVDTGFLPGFGPNVGPLAVAVQSDGKVLLGGSFVSYNGTPRKGLLRILPGGSLDVAFDPGGGFDGAVAVLTIQPDGRVLVGGSFNLHEGAARRSISRVGSDGRLDGSFNPGSGGGAVLAMVRQPDDKVLLGGQFETYDGKTAGRVARVHLKYLHSAMNFTGNAVPLTVGDSALAGRATVSLTSGGQYSAKLAFGAETLTYTGVFDSFGMMSGSRTRRDGAMVTLSLALSRNGKGAVLMSGEAVDTMGRTARVVAEAAYFSSTRLPANHFSGRYHSYFDPFPLFAGEPAGYGFMTLRVASSGRVTMSGKVCDGTALTASGNLNDEGKLRLHFSLYSGKGFLNGEVRIQESLLVPQKRPVFGDLKWKRPVSTGLFPSGILQSLRANGGLYLAKGTVQRPFGGTAVNSVRVTLGQGNSILTGLQSDLAFGLNGIAVVVPGGGLEGLKLSVNRSTGGFSGSFIPFPGARAVTLQGILNSESQGRGFTLVPNGGVTLPSQVELNVLAP